MLGVMEPRVSLVTLGVGDLARSKAFYEQLGWRGQEVEETVFVQAGGLALGAVGSRQARCGLRPGGRTGGRLRRDRPSLRTSASAGEVDAIVAAAALPAATVTRPPAETFYGGYAGVFTDPDGHAWEIAHNPASRSPRTAP